MLQTRPVCFAGFEDLPRRARTSALGHIWLATFIVYLLRPNARFLFSSMLPRISAEWMFMLLAANNVWFIVRSGFNQSTMVAYGTCSGSASFCVENVFRETTIMCRMEFEFCALLRHCIVYDHVWDSVTDAQFLGSLAFFFFLIYLFLFIYLKKK